MTKRDEKSARDEISAKLEEALLLAGGDKYNFVAYLCKMAMAELVLMDAEEYRRAAVGKSN